MLCVLTSAIVTACASGGNGPPPPAPAGPAAPTVAQAPKFPAAALGPPPVMRVLTSGLSNPWELLWGPDNYLWVTEKTGKKIDRINPDNGATSTVLTIPEVSASGGQDGLLGMAFDGEALFVIYTYGPTADLHGKIVRYQYNKAAATLANPVEILNNLPAGPDHDAGRLIIGPDHKLYYALGDLGNNQFDRACLPIRAQDIPTQAQVAAKDWGAYQGKVLRINPDGSVPADNPVIKGVRSHVFTYGHRNPQGLVVGPGGRIFVAEHGPKSDDEINVLRAGGNYGWPFVAGFRDGEAYQYANWSAAPNCKQLEYDDYDIPPSVPKGPGELQWNSRDYVEPIKTNYTVPNGHNFKDPACGEEYDLCWPSIAPGSIDYMPAEGSPSPQLANSLLVPALKTGTLITLRLTGDGGSAQGDFQQLWPTRNRYRDLAISPDRKKLYIATDSEGSSGPQSLQKTGKLDNPGSILEFSLTVSPQVPSR